MCSVVHDVRELLRTEYHARAAVSTCRNRAPIALPGKSPRLSVYLDAEVREIEFGRTWGDEMLMGIKLRRKGFAKEEVCFDRGLFRVCSRSKIDGHGHVLPGRRVSQSLERVPLGSEPGGWSLKTSKSSLSQAEGIPQSALRFSQRLCNKSSIS